MELRERVSQLKQEKNAVILAHYYVEDEVQAVADYVGDSYGLSKLATTIPQENIIFAGVEFMGESAKILNPEKKVVMLDASADCPMAHMVDVATIEAAREKYEDLAVVCYVNSTAEIKSASDVCVTSSNAVKVVKNLPNKRILFVPDQNLGRYVAEKLPEKEFIFHDGYCPVHVEIKREDVLKLKEKYNHAKVLAHPECTKDLLAEADYIGSTKEIIDYATASEDKEFLIATEIGVFYELKEKNPDKIFHKIDAHQFCPDMKKNTMEKLVRALEELTPEVQLPEEIRTKAYHPLAKMLELAAK